MAAPKSPAQKVLTDKFLGGLKAQTDRKHRTIWAGMDGKEAPQVVGSPRGSCASSQQTQFLACRYRRLALPEHRR